MKRKTELRGRAARLARLLPAAPSRAARTPFVLLIVVLLSGGLITLLMLNSALNEGSFDLSRLKKQTTELTDEEQALQREVDGYADPGALDRRARELGMVPGGGPAFLGPDGTVHGVTPSPAPTPPPSATPSAAKQPAAPGAPASGTSTSGTAPSTTRATGTAATTPSPKSPGGTAGTTHATGRTPAPATPPSTSAHTSTSASTPAAPPASTSAPSASSTSPDTDLGQVTP